MPEETFEFKKQFFHFLIPPLSVVGIRTTVGALSVVNVMPTPQAC